MSEQTKVSYKDPKELGLGGAKSLSVPQAQGGNYRVAVGGYTKASDTGMGRLASSLQGINQALGAYANMAVKREERSLDELRRMSNEKKRALIGAENKVFRKMGIRPQSILQVKQSLGTAETGRFQAEWQEHLDNVLIPSQAEAGDPLTASQIQQEYTKYRQDWAKDNQFLSKSQLATDGFLAETDGLFDRNSAYYFKSADGYYEQNVQRFSAAEALWAVADMQPEQFVAEYTKISASMDTSTMRKVIGDMTNKAIQSGDVTYIDKMQSMLGTLGDPDNKAKLGSESLANTMQLKLFSLGLDNAETDAEFKGLEKTSRKAGYELEAKQREADKMIAQFRVDYENAKTPEEKRQVQIDFSQTTIYKDTDVVQQAYLLDKLALLEKERNSLETTRRTEEARRDAENTTSILKVVQDDVNSMKPTEEINKTVEEQKKVAQQYFDDGMLSEKSYQDIQGKLHSLSLKTTHDTMQAAKGRELSNEGQLTPTLEAARIGNEHYAIINEVKESLVDVNGKPLGERRIAKYLETSVMGNTSGYAYSSQRLNKGTESILTKHTVDIAEKRLEISQQVFSEMSPQRNGVIGPEMLAERDKRLAAYVEARTKQTVKELINFSNEGEQAAREQELISAGYDVANRSQTEIEEQFAQMKQWEQIKETQSGRELYNLTQDPSSGVSTVKIRNRGFDFNTSKDLSKGLFGIDGAFNHLSKQWTEAYEILHQPEAISIGTGEEKESIPAFDALTDENKVELSTAYRQIMTRKNVQGERHIDALVKDVDRGPMNMVGGVRGQMLDPSSREEQTYQGRKEATKKLLTAYELGGVPTEHWREQGYKDGNSEFTLRGFEGDVKSGIGYQKRNELAFVPVETIQKLHDFVTSDKAVGNITADLQTALQNLPKEDIAVVKEALSAFYITGEKSAESALQELFNKHRAIYSVKQGYNFYK